MTSGAKTLWLATTYPSNGGLAMAPSGDLYLSSTGTGDIVQINSLDQSITTCVSGIDHPRGLTFNPNGNLFFTEYNTNKIYWIYACGGSLSGGQTPGAHFHAKVVENRVFGLQWPLGASIALTIDDPVNGPGVDFTDTQTVIVAPFNPETTVVNFNDLGQITLATGMLISMTDGHVIKDHIVTDLVVTGVNVDLNTVWGTGTPAENIGVCYSGCNWRRNAIIQLDRTWQVDFSVPGGSSPEEQNVLDIIPGLYGEALQSDDDTDITDYQWHAPSQPIIFTQYNQNTVFGYDGWLDGATVTLTVDDPGTPANPDYTAGQIASRTDRPDLQPAFRNETGARL